MENSDLAIPKKVHNMIREFKSRGFAPETRQIFSEDIGSESQETETVSKLENVEPKSEIADFLFKML